MDSKSDKQSNHRRSTSLKLSISSSKQSTKGCSDVKGRFARAVRRTLLLRQPSHKRVSSTGFSGYTLPGEITTETELSSFDSPSRSLRPDSAVASVLSVEAVDVFGSTPSVFLTLPSTRGRRTHMVHRGNSMSPPKRPVAKRLRFSHPVVSRTIQAIGSDDIPGIQAYTRIPSAEELAEQFPDEVNVLEIATRKRVSLEIAKHKIDGIKFHNGLPVKFGDEFEMVDAHREAALAALTGASAPPNKPPPAVIPSSLCPGHRRSHSTFEMAPAIQEVELNRLTVPPKAPGMRPTSCDSLSFIPYSTFFENAPIAFDEGTAAPVSARLSAQAIRHSQVYASVEGLQDQYPAFDSALMTAYKAVKAKAEASLSPNAPSPYAMVDNGFPVLNKAHHIKFAAEPKYQRRSISREEHQALQHDEKRKSQIPSGEYTAVKKRKRASIAGRCKSLLY